MEVFFLQLIYKCTFEGYLNKESKSIFRVFHVSGNPGRHQ